MLFFWILLIVILHTGSGLRWVLTSQRLVASVDHSSRSTVPIKTVLFAVPNSWEAAFDDDDEYNTFTRIASNYLKNKLRLYFNQQGNAATTLKPFLTAILPPVTEAELAKEVQRIIKDLSELSASEESIAEAVLQNEYWRTAGQRVVFELIYLDCVYANYYQRDRGPLLSDADYDDLKSALNWEGSAISSISAKEALFITAVAAFHRNQPLLAEADYKALKEQLKAENSWVVQRIQDPLERLGLSTFLGYLHCSLRGR